MDRGPEAQDADGRATDPSLVQRAADVAGAAAAAGVAAVEAKPLREVLALLQWTFPAGHVTPQGQADYIDGSCLVYAEERLLDVVDFRGAHSTVPASDGHKASSASLEWSAGRGKAASVLHSGDVMSAEGGTHAIRVRLEDLPDRATECFFVISAYNCRNLSLFRSLSMRLFDAERPPRLLSQFTLADAGGSSAVVVSSLARRPGAWATRALSRACGATVRDYGPVEAAVAPLQERHRRWRRRRPYVLLGALWAAGRAHPRAGVPEAGGPLQRALGLPAVLLRGVLQFL